MIRNIAIGLLSITLSGCIWLEAEPYYEDDSYGYYDHYYDYGPGFIDAGWECYNNNENSMDDWYFWARVYDDGYYDLDYVLVEIIHLTDGRNVSFRIEENVNGYFNSEWGFWDPVCGTPVDIYYTVLDMDGNWDEYILYW